MEKLLNDTLQSLEDCKASDITHINTKAKNPLFDSIVIATGTTSTHTRAIAKNLVRDLKKLGHKKSKVSGEEYGQWIVIDTNYLIIHIMLPETREYYNLEEIWS